MVRIEPTIPLKHAELLHVAMATVVHVLETKTDYPTESMRSVVKSYKVSRDRHLTALGYSGAQIKLFTEAATDALVTWLEGREHNKSMSIKDFDQWSSELMDDD